MFKRGKETRTKIAEVLRILDDGRWHSIDEIEHKAKLNSSQSKKITEFLNRYDFVTVNDDRNRVKLKEAARRFLTQKATS